MERHRCKICSKCFSNGKAIGGHMRTHLAFLPVPPKPKGPQEHEDSIKVNSLVPLRSTKEGEEESNYESMQKINRKRSKKCKSIDELVDLSIKQKTTGLISITSPIEDVALAVMMLSNGKWKDGKEKEEKRKRKMEENKTCENESEERKNDNIDDNDHKTANDYTMYSTRLQTRSQTHTLTRVEAPELYRCDTCIKVFRSYQSLENHRTRHREIGVQIHKCEHCSKVFKSGQALGGHKKIHTSSSSDCAKINCNLIDLNLPPPEEDEVN